MKVEKVEAKNKAGDVLGSGSYKHVENMKEAVSEYTEEGVLKLLNQAARTNCRNGLAKPAGTGGAVKKAAYSCYIKLTTGKTKMAPDVALGVTGLTVEEVANFAKAVA